MELTVDQALQQAVAAHKESKLQEAERLYRAILQAQPNHPDANHNLGVLAVAVGKPIEAIPLFKLALEANPAIEQFRLSYIDALIKMERFEDAKRVLAEGERSGVSLDKLDAIKQRLKVSSSGAEPPQDQLNCLLEHYQAGRLEEAEALATLLTQQFPKHPFGWKVLGAVFEQTGRVSESLLPMQESADLSPQDAEAHSNLGATLKELGRLDDAEASLRQAIALKPDFAEAHNNLGVTLKELGRLDDAEASYREAIALRPDYAEAHYNLGTALRELGRLDESVSAFFRAINFKADFDDAYFNLGAALKRTRHYAADQSLYPILINLLIRENFVRPIEVAGAILNLLRVDNQIEEVLLATTASSNVKEVDWAIKTLAQVPLLHQLMRVCSLPELDFEALFVSLRRLLLKSLGKLDTSSEAIDFLSTLSLHCFTNEFVYPETDEESELIGNLETAVAECLAQASQPTIEQLLCLATYRPLHLYSWSEKLQALQQLPEVQSRLLEEPRAEREIALDMPVLAAIEDDVSRKVMEQYEGNPYPRWVKLRVPPEAKSVAKVCDEHKLCLHSETIRRQLSPSILIAGCGTGQHSIETASLFANCQVTAVDLSSSSLAYAQRKTNELGITNIEYLQADILHLGELEQDFDIIESSGVLHHMDDPMAGWRVLVGLLKIGGLMKIGLYSELARRPVVKTREDIAVKGIGTSEAEIRQFRQFLVESHEKHHQQLTGLRDFFSLSEFRDLVFHVQEHRFTALQIRGCLEELGLKFCGFERLDVVSIFKDFFGENADTCDLSLWQQFEERNPRTFLGMYEFWCQKI